MGDKMTPMVYFREQLKKNNGKILKVCLNLHSFIHLFIHSGYFYSASSSPPPHTGPPDYSADTVSDLHAGAPQATASEGLAQGP